MRENYSRELYDRAEWEREQARASLMAMYGKMGDVLRSAKERPLVVSEYDDARRQFDEAAEVFLDKQGRIEDIAGRAQDEAVAANRRRSRLRARVQAANEAFSKFEREQRSDS